MSNMVHRPRKNITPSDKFAIDGSPHSIVSEKSYDARLIRSWMNRWKTTPS